MLNLCIIFTFSPFHIKSLTDMADVVHATLGWVERLSITILVDTEHQANEWVL